MNQCLSMSSDSRDVAISHVGKDVLTHHVTTSEKYQKATKVEQKALEAGAWEAWMAFLLMKGSDCSQCGSLMKSFGSQFSLGNDQYPATVLAVTDILSNHKVDQKYYDNKDAARKRSQKQNQEKEQKESKEDKETSFAQSEEDADCYACGKKGHRSSKCKNKPKNYDDWFVNKAMNARKTRTSLAQSRIDEEDAEEKEDLDDQADEDESVQSRASNRSTTTRRGRSGNGRTPARGSQRSQYRSEWSAFQQECSDMDENEPDHMCFASREWSDLSKVMILDTGSTIGGTFMNPDMVYDIRPSTNPTRMKTNAGTKRMAVTASVPGFGNVWYDPTNMANIFGFSSMKDKVTRIVYDSDIEDAFVITQKNKEPIKFERNNEGLYTYKPTDLFVEGIASLKGSLPPMGSERQVVKSWPQNRQVSFMISSVRENLMGYTPRQIKDARAARKLYRAIRSPTVANMKLILKQNLIEECPVTSKDVEVAELIFGPEVGTLKGKTVRKKSPVVKSDIIEIPKEILDKHQNLVLEIDLMFVNRLPMLTTIDTSIKFRSLVPLESQTAEVLYKALDVVLRKYNKNSFRVTKIRCDNQFKPLMEDIEDNLGIEMNYAPRDEHVPAAERNNRTIGERIRVTYHALPYKAMPKIMLVNLAMACAWQLNLFPVKGGVSAYYSPYVIMGGRPINYRKDLMFPFGTYVQATLRNDPTNTNAPTTVDAIYLRPMRNDQGGHEVMSLATGRKILPNKVFELPVTQTVIEHVEAMAEAQGIKTLKLSNKRNTVFYPSDWITGVDYNPDDPDTYDEIVDDDDEYVPHSDEEDEWINPHEDMMSDEARLQFEEENKNWNWDGPDESNEGSEDGFDPIDQEEINDLLSEDPRVRMTYRGVEIVPDPYGEVEMPDEPNRIEREAQASEGERTTGRTRTQTGALDRVTYSHLMRGEPAKFTKHELNKHYCKVVKAPMRYCFTAAEWTGLEHCHNMYKSESNRQADQEYDLSEALVIARIIMDIHTKAEGEDVSLAQNYIYQKGIKKFGSKGRKAGLKELDQLHKRHCFSPIDINSLTPAEKKRAMEALMFLTEKSDGTVKGRMVYNGKPTREWMSREDSASPTAALESIFLTSIIDAKEKRDVMTADVPNAFIQTPMPDSSEKVVMKITGVLVHLMVEMAPEIYGPYVVYENGKKVLYVRVLKALYGMLVASLLWYTKFKKDLEGQGFEFNPYDPCVANKMVNGKQHTIRFHVDDLMCSHVDPQVNTKFLKWLNSKYGTYGDVKATRGKIHDYLGMQFDFSKSGMVIIGMVPYMKAMVDEFSVEFKPSDTARTPAPSDLFAKGESPPLNEEMAEEYHTFVAKALFACKRARPDIQPTVAALCTRVKDPNQDDWNKLIRLLKYINGTREDRLFLSADDLSVIKWYVDVAFAVHPDFKSHTGGGMTFGTGMPINTSRKQKLNTRSSTESELVGADDMAQMILWTKFFMEAQGYDVKDNILYQDNKSTILLENNGKRSSGKRTRAINIRYFFLTDQVEKGNLRVEYCPTAEMNGDYMSKPLQGSLFEKFRSRIMGHEQELPHHGGMPGDKPQKRGNRSVLEESHISGASVRPMKGLRGKCTRDTTTSDSACI